jgi:hypothetical protein
MEPHLKYKSHSIILMSSGKYKYLILSYYNWLNARRIKLKLKRKV